MSLTPRVFSFSVASEQRSLCLLFLLIHLCNKAGTRMSIIRDTKSGGGTLCDIYSRQSDGQPLSCLIHTPALTKQRALHCPCQLSPFAIRFVDSSMPNNIPLLRFKIMDAPCSSIHAVSLPSAFNVFNLKILSLTSSTTDHLTQIKEYIVLIILDHMLDTS